MPSLNEDTLNMDEELGRPPATPRLDVVVAEVVKAFLRFFFIVWKAERTTNQQ
jgi:hypothetical protein